MAREEGLPAEQGECRLCDNGATEDIPHLLLDCAAHDRHRTKMIQVVERELAACGKGCLDLIPHTDQVDMLLGKSTGQAKADAAINKSVTCS